MSNQTNVFFCPHCRINSSNTDENKLAKCPRCKRQRSSGLNLLSETMYNQYPHCKCSFPPCLDRCPNRCLESSLKGEVMKDDKEFQKFLNRFNFRPQGEMLVGIERECFLTNLSGKIIPISVEVLEELGKGERFAHDLPKCQLEDRVGPVVLKQVRNELEFNERRIKEAEQKLGFKRSFVEVGPLDTPIDVSPDSTGRYQEIEKSLPKETLLSACRVIGTHVHIGMPSHEIALMVYNHVIKFTDQLCALGDGSNGERFKIYKQMAPDFNPPYYNSWRSFYQEALSKGFIKDPRSCWHLVRLSIHGTIEFRMFGATPDIHKVYSWAEKCWSLCNSNLL